MHSSLIFPSLLRRTNTFGPACAGFVLIVCTMLASTVVVAQGATEEQVLKVQQNIASLNQAIAAQQNYIQSLPNMIDPTGYASDPQYKAQMDAYIAQQTQQANAAIAQMQASVANLTNWLQNTPITCPPDPSYCGLNLTGD